MANRRQFIQSGLVLSSAPLIASFPARLSATEFSSLELQYFVFDNRFKETIEIAHLVAQQGVILAETSGDLTNLWYDQLDLQWKSAPMMLAGITTQRSLFVLETFALDRGMKVVYRSEHPSTHEIPLYSWIIAPRFSNGALYR